MFAYSLPAHAQTPSPLNLLVGQINNNNSKLPVEKLYLQLDKTNYIQNDTLWFKAYLLNADYLSASAISGLMYVELDDSNNKCLERIMLPMLPGLSWGNMALGENEIPEGSYTLRAYTNWMRNFGEDYVFKKQIYIASAAVRSRLITAGFKETSQAGKDNIQAGLLFRNLNQYAVRLQDMRLRVTDGRHILAKANMATDVDGKLNINFDLQPNTDTKNLSIIAQDKTGGATPVPFIIPVVLNRPANTDLQFMPEGGTLIAGISTRIGFKAISEDGKSADVNGNIYNSKQQQVAGFRSMHKGMGVFEFTPQAGETYTAALALPGGKTKSYQLPAVKAFGVGLRVNNSATDDSLQVNIAITPNPVTGLGAGEYYLIGSSRNVVYYAARLTVNRKKAIAVPKSAFPPGIVHFTLLNTANLPLAERLAFIEPDDNLQINITANQKNYAPHDSIALNLQVTDHAGKPVRGSFSIAVTDDNQVKTDSLNGNIINNILLTSDLKGTVEDPGYYFDSTNPQRLAHLDNLLLTQGWIGYDWKQVFSNKINPVFAPEPGFAVKGRVTGMFNKPAAASAITLLSKKPAMVMDTVTDKDGRFTFKGFLPVDTASFFLQALNKHGKSNNVSITVDEFIAPVFVQTMPRVSPWYVNNDTLLLHSINNYAVKLQADQKLQGYGHLLKEVKVTDKKIIKNSKNLNGPGAADESLDEQDMLKAGKMTLADLLESKIKGFREGYLRHSVIQSYVINDEPVNIVIDGIYINRFYTPSRADINGLFHYVQGYLTQFTAEDITGVEVMYNPQYNSSYIGTFLSPLLIGDPIAFIEVTTRGGHGPFTQKTPGTYLYRPLAATLPKQFYRPKYTAKSTGTNTDLRATIHWEPNIITDTAGRATVSFYSADKPAGYTIIVEGANLNGQIGFKRGKVLVK